MAMPIANLGLGKLASSVLGSRRESSPKMDGLAALSKASKSSGGGAAHTATFRQILQNFDVTQITPSQYSQMINELHKSGAVNDDEFRELASIRLEMDKAGYVGDEPVNLLSFVRDRLEKLVGQAASGAEDIASIEPPSPEEREKNIALAKRQVDWLEKFSAIHRDSSPDALDTVA